MNEETLCKANLWVTDKILHLEADCDASDYAKSAVLSQNERPVAFMLKTL